MVDRNRIFAFGLLAGALLASFGFLTSQSMLGPLLQQSLLTPEEQMLGSVHQHLTEQYVEPRSAEALLHTAVQGMVKGLDDPYSQFLGPDSLARFEEDSSGTLIGIGIIMFRSGQIHYPLVNGPAERAGIRPGDQILSIDGIPLAEIPSPDRIMAIKGLEGTQVSLLLQRLDGSKFRADVRRTPISNRTVGKIGLLDVENGIGTLLVRSFAKSTPSELDSALKALLARGMKALVLDLRFNTGGLLDAAVAVAGRFVRGGVICTLLGRNGDRRVRKADPSNYIGVELPITILMNEFSASGSEVVAGCLRDRGAAVLVGNKSFGKGVFQKVQQYPDGHFVLKYTAGYFLTPNGRILEGNIKSNMSGGLEPDLRTPSPSNLGALRIWLATELPPDKYLKQTAQLFPNLATRLPPEDLAKDAAVELLRLSLASQ